MTHRALAGFLALLLLSFGVAHAQDDPAANVPFRELTAVEHDLVSLAVHADGKRAFVVDDQGSLHGLKLPGGELEWSTSVREPGSICRIDVGESYVSYPFGPAAIVFDAENGESLSRVGMIIKGHAFANLCDPKDRWVWIATREGSMGRINPKDINGWSHRPMKNGGITAIAMDAGGKLIAVGGKDKTIRFLNAKSASVDKKKVFEGLSGAPLALALDAKAKLVVCAEETGEVNVRKMSSGKVSAVLTGHSAKLIQLAIDAKGRWVAGGHEDGVIVLWDLKKGERLAVLMREGSGPVTGLEFMGKKAELMSHAKGTTLTAWDLSGF